VYVEDNRLETIQIKYFEYFVEIKSETILEPSAGEEDQGSARTKTVTRGRKVCCTQKQRREELLLLVSTTTNPRFCDRNKFFVIFKSGVDFFSVSEVFTGSEF
jgi:hypothetical protein